MMTALTLHIPQAAQAAIYRPGQPVKICDRPPTLAGEAVLPSFTLNLTTIWSSSARA
ncbi:MAG: hypothetical protein HC838_16100 [Spirulinaceae cyanobacterium RM2_2_10]|nr:hypothetical protein [Spirulinaceae cyanobacterium RM2_2_10]